MGPVSIAQAHAGAEILLGFLLAWTTAKPQLSWLLILLFLGIGFRQKRHTFLASFAASCAFFLGISFVLVPGWPAGWLDALSRYAAYRNSWPLLNLFLRGFLPQSLADPSFILLLLAALGYTGFEFRKYWRGAGNLTWLIVWCGFISYLLSSRSVSYDQVIFLIPILAWIHASPAHRRGWAVFFVIGSVVASWALFVLSKLDPANPYWPELPVLFHTIWLFYIFRSQASAQTSRLRPGRGEPQPGTVLK